MIQDSKIKNPLVIVFCGLLCTFMTPQPAHAALSFSNFAGYDLETLIDQAKLLIRKDVKDEGLSKLITKLANENIDVENMTSL